MTLKYDKFILLGAIFAEKRLVKVFQSKGLYLCVKILNEKSAFSPAKVVFEK